jgi:hypothetical protein
MKKALIKTGMVFLLAGGSVMAQDSNTNSFNNNSTNTTTIYNNNSTNTMVGYDQPPIFRANEFQIEAFGTDSLNQHTIDHLSGDRIRHHSTLGAGLGVSYFFLPFLGVTGEGYTENTAHNFVDDADGSLIARIPISLGRFGIAPYAFGGGGHKFDPIEASYWQAGGGVEFRFGAHLGVFVDARYVGIDKIQNYGLGRAGIRYSF